MRLLTAGYAPFCPHLTCYLGGPTPEIDPGSLGWENWMESDLPWVAVSDALLRLPGASKGADVEVAYAEQHGIPVFYTMEELLAASNT